MADASSINLALQSSEINPNSQPGSTLKIAQPGLELN